jgi:16S rRNA (guanine966-N2)-methyltransferase
MSEKIRGALFNVLGDIDGLSAMDAYAGSGALSIEAVSRGAAKAVAIDVDKAAHRTIEENVSALGLEAKIKVVRANVTSWSENNPDTRFDLLFCDPPYDQVSLSALQKLVRHLNRGGLICLSLPGELTAPEFQGLTLEKQSQFGDAQLVFYKKN